MTQTERRVWLIKYLQKEMPEYASYPIPVKEEKQWYLLRGLLNMRMPRAASDEFLKVQDEYLQQMTKDKGIVDAETLPVSKSDSRLVLWQGDITRLKADAIANACNSALLGCFHPNHNCIDNIEHTMAGVQMRYDCFKQMEIQGHDEETGKCKITSGYNLPAKYVLHTVGPIVQGPLSQKHIDELISCYVSCLEKADEYGLGSVAFCCISTGVFMFPQDKAAEIAVRTVTDWLDEHPESSVKKVIFNVFKDHDLELYARILG